MSRSSNAYQKIEDILQQNEYRVYDQSPSVFEIWWGKVKAWFTDLMAKWFPAFEPSESVAITILIAIIVVMAVGVLFALFLLTRHMKRNRAFRAIQPMSSMNELNWSFHQHLKEAKDQENLHNYALATRHLFLSLLLYFQDREWLEIRMWKTNGEYYDDLRKEDHHGADLFYQCAFMFDKVTYGEDQVRVEEYLQIRDKVMSKVGEHSGE